MSPISIAQITLSGTTKKLASICHKCFLTVEASQAVFEEPLGGEAVENQIRILSTLSSSTATAETGQ